MQKKLSRSRKNVMVGGVLAGIAEYMNQDATLWRLAFVVLLIATGLMPGVLIYLVAWIMIPVAATYTATEAHTADDKTHDTV